MQEDRSITSAEVIEESIEKENVGEDAPKGKVVKKSGKRIGYNYIIYKSLKESHKNDVMKCIYIKGLFNFGTCVIKEGTLGDSKDKQGRDIKDRLVWQKELHELLQDKVRIPRYLGSFEENGNYYLVIERIKGDSLVQILKKYSKELREGLINRNKLGIKFLGYLLKIIEVLEKLHQNRIVHRDASSNNFMITPRGEIALIDMELSYSISQQFPSPPFQLGTFGFMSPQQIATLVPTLEEDIFALGAIIFQMWTYISPSKIVDSTYDELTRKIHFFIPDQKIAEIVIQCLHPDSSHRPSLDNIKKIIQEYKNKQLSKRATTHPYIYSRQEILHTIQQAITTYSTPLLADPEKGWFAENFKDLVPQDKNKISKAWYGSFNQGTAGIIYMLSQAKAVGFDINPTLPFLQKGLELIEQKYINKEMSTSPSLYFGSSGIAASIYTALQAGLIECEPKYIAWINKLLDNENKNLDIVTGIAGQGIANIICSSVIDKEQLFERLNLYVNQLLSEQQSDGSWTKSPTSKKKKIVKGFAVGISGMIYFLLEYGQQFDDRNALTAAELGLQWLIRKGKRNKQTIYWTSDSGKELGNWLSQGTTGIALSFIKAYAVTGNQQYKNIATAALNCYTEKNVNNNLSQNNGISGLGEVLLEAYKTFEDPIWLKKADGIVQNILHLQKNHPNYGPYWLTDHERQPTSSFMGGNSGLLHFLIRHAYPSNISLPMSANQFLPVAIQATHII